MNTIDGIRSLSDDELAVVDGGMECAAAIALGWVYTTTAVILNAAGNKEGAQYFLGKSQGLLQGACPQ